MSDAPTDIKVKRAEGILEVTWPDQRLTRYKVRDLRCACGCAGCVDERTGMKTLKDGTVPEDIGITDMKLVGRYAILFVFTDGHDTGIYSWDALRRIPAG